MAITTMDEVVSALSISNQVNLFFPTAPNVSGGLVNLNQIITSSFGQMSPPSSYESGGTTYNQSTKSVGFPKWTANGSKSAYVGRWSSSFTTIGTVHLYDLLWSCSSFSSIVTTAQSVVGFSGMPTRNSTGLGAEIWIGCNGSTGATASNVTVQYTNSSGVSGRNTVSTAMIASMPIGRMFQVPLQSGDVGVQSIQSITFSASTGTAGSVQIFVLDRIASIGGSPSNVGVVQDFVSLGMPLIYDESCLMFISQGSTTSTGIIMGQLTIMHG